MYLSFRIIFKYKDKERQPDSGIFWKQAVSHRLEELKYVI